MEDNNYTGLGEETQRPVPEQAGVTAGAVQEPVSQVPPEALSYGTPPSNAYPYGAPQTPPGGNGYNPYPPEGAPVPGAAHAKPRKALPFLLIGAAVLIVLIVVLVLVLPGRSGSSGSEAVSLSAYIDADGTAYIVKNNGDVVEIDEEVSQAALSPDGKHIAVVGEDESVYVLDGKGGNKAELSEEGTTLIAVRNSGFIFSRSEQPDADTILQDLVDDYNDSYGGSLTFDQAQEYCHQYFGTSAEDAMDCYYDYLYEDYTNYHPIPSVYYRYTWKADAPVEIGSDVINYCISDSSLNLLYASDDSVYIVRQGDTEPLKLQSVKGTYALPLAMTDSGMAVWGDSDGAEVTYYVATGDEAVKFGKLDTSSESSLSIWSNSVYFTGGEKQLLILNVYSEKLLYGEIGGEAEALRLGAEPSYNKLYTENGLLPSSSKNSIDGVYVELESSDGYDICYISMDGERDKVVDDNYDIVGTAEGWLYYLSEDEDLRAVRISGAEVKDEEKVASDVYRAYIGDEGRLYYFRDYDSDDSIADLYYKDGDKDGQKLESEVYPLGYMGYGGSAAYLTDYEYISDASYYMCGTLYIFDGKESVRIASDVMSIRYTGDFYNLDSFVYLKFDDTDIDENGYETVYCKLCWFDGKESTTIASDILY